jgi:hypothetical protein
MTEEESIVFENIPQMVVNEPRDDKPAGSLSLETVTDFFFAIPNEYFPNEEQTKYTEEQKEKMIDIIDEKNWYIKLSPVMHWDGSGSMAMFLLPGSDTKYIIFETTKCESICMQEIHVFEYKNKKLTDITDARLPKIDQEKVKTAFLYVLPREGTKIKIIEQRSRFEDENHEKNIVAEIFWRKGVFSLEYR